MNNLEEIERSIIKTYRKDIWCNFMKAVVDYELVKENDHIAVCISGGKDSFLLAKCMQELQKHGKVKFDLEFIMMNPGFSNDALQHIIDMAKYLKIELKIFNTNVFGVVTKLNIKSPCFLCSKMRRGYLYDEAKKLHCNKIALGHHFNDVIETTLIDMFYNGRFEGMLPKLKSRNFEGLELIRPLYLVRESSIINWVNYNKLSFSKCDCILREDNSKRLEIKKLIEKLSKENEFFEDNVFKSLDNVNLTQILGYKLEDKKWNYLDDYDNK